MEEYNRDLLIIQSWPILQGYGIVETATRSAAHMLKSKDVKLTMKHVYCDLPMSPILRTGFSMMIELINKGIPKHNKF